IDQRHLRRLDRRLVALHLLFAGQELRVESKTLHFFSPSLSGDAAVFSGAVASPSRRIGSTSARVSPSGSGLASSAGGGGANSAGSTGAGVSGAAIECAASGAEGGVSSPTGSGFGAACEPALAAVIASFWTRSNSSRRE